MRATRVCLQLASNPVCKGVSELRGGRPASRPAAPRRLETTRAARGAGPAQEDRPKERRTSGVEDAGAKSLEAAAMRTKAARVVLQKGKSRLFWGASGSPIVFGGAVDKIVGAQPKNGDAVLLCDHNNNTLGWGAVNMDSMYRVRVLQTAAEAAGSPDATLSFPDIVAKRLSAAAATRRRMGLPQAGSSTGYRLVNSEGDRLSGLVVDVFGEYAVIAVTAAWAEQNRAAVAAAVLKETGAKAVLWRANADYLRIEGLQGSWPPTIITPDGTQTQLKSPGWVGGPALADGAAEVDGALSHQPPQQPALAEASTAEPDTGDLAESLPDPYEVLEDGVRYQTSLAKGQKTGFYFDQRDNRARIRKWSAGGRVLDLCCYSGGFAINAALGGAVAVTAVDSSASALRLAAANAHLNGVADKCEFVESDVLAYLQGAVAKGQTNSFDVVILDPPKLAPTRDALPRAKGHYRRLNELAARLIKPGGLLVSCTCSGAMTQSGEFPALVMDAASAAGKSATLLVQSGAASDHVIHPGYPEGNYLTCVFIGIQ